jgi:hypothetical protein
MRTLLIISFLVFLGGCIPYKYTETFELYDVASLRNIKSLAVVCCNNNGNKTSLAVSSSLISKFQQLNRFKVLSYHDMYNKLEKLNNSLDIEDSLEIMSIGKKLEVDVMVLYWSDANSNFSSEKLNIIVYSNISQRMIGKFFTSASGTESSFSFENNVERITTNTVEAYLNTIALGLKSNIVVTSFDPVSEHNEKNAAQNKDTITNDNIIEMTKNGDPPPTIIKKIHEGIPNFDLSSNAIARLNRQLVDFSVITEMKKYGKKPE